MITGREDGRRLARDPPGSRGEFGPAAPRVPAGSAVTSFII